MKRLAGVRICIAGADNGLGLSRDAEVLLEVLAAAGARVNWEPVRRRRGLRWLGAKIGVIGRFLPHYDLVLVLEQPVSWWFPFAPRHILVPNPEWFYAGRLHFLNRVDLILAKSREAVQVLQDQAAPVRLVGFTSQDRRDPTVPRRREALHIAGATMERRGTSALLSVWANHPEWPRLIVVDAHGLAELEGKASGLGNVLLRRGRLSDEELRQLQNTCRIHVLPSLVEGFGHTLVEGMSCGAVVVTTDAPPMNEVVGPDRGVLVGWERTGVQNLGTQYYVARAALETALVELLSREETELDTIGRAARDWFETNDRTFRERILDAICGTIATNQVA